MEVNNRTIIGRTKRGALACISTLVLNSHVLLMGKSGSGKSTTMMSLILQKIIEGCLVIAINWRRCLDESSIIPELQERYRRYRYKIDVAKEGLCMPLFTPQKDFNGNEETPDRVIARGSNMLKVAGELTEPQTFSMWEAVSAVFRQDLYHESGIQSVDAQLRSQEKRTASSAAERIQALCGTNVFRDGSFLDSAQPKIYEIDLKGFEYDDQSKIIKGVVACGSKYEKQQRSASCASVWHHLSFSACRE